ncbi:hypothetical protein [Streptococcus sp. CSL10205-OR2]|uniref:hypothetical protein n=1 Tax=Streptococcus sp. CSL10205-OR2 TaxID=2980558 RepID=UPI0021D87670|nr:hypothetical protein [Streptococcus sp. CSL10205-OR2]MCU9533559.1 hypothetical protein [Streptococcus sp. CSL10205-OR2]
MNLRLKILLGIVIVLLIGGGGTITMLNEEHPSFLGFQTARQKQITYLREHEKEMEDYIKSKYPTVESVQFDWDSIEVGQEGNGTPQGGAWVLSIRGKFNHLEHTKFVMAFGLDSKDSLPSTERMGFIIPLYIYRDGGWNNY